MHYKAQGWVDKAENGNLQRRSLWFLLDKHLWLNAKYGLYGNTDGFKHLEKCLNKKVLEDHADWRDYKFGTASNSTG